MFIIHFKIIIIIIKMIKYNDNNDRDEGVFIKFRGLWYVDGVCCVMGLQCMLEQ